MQFFWKKDKETIEEPEDRFGTFFHATEKNDFEIIAIQRHEGLTTVKFYHPEKKSGGEYYIYRMSDAMHEVFIRKFAKDFKGFLVEGENPIIELDELDGED